jgi:hypothetical protein
VLVDGTLTTVDIRFDFQENLFWEGIIAGLHGTANLNGGHDFFTRHLLLILSKNPARAMQSHDRLNFQVRKYLF